MAEQDLPTFIDFVLEETGYEKLSYVGHSEGTTQMFLGASLNPDYFNQKVNLFVALAPVANTATVDGPFLLAIAPYFHTMEFIMVHILGMYNWFNPVCGTQLINICQQLGVEE